MNNLTEMLITIATGVIGLATIAVLVSRNANTSGVIRESGNAFSRILSTAVSPVSGGGMGGAGLSLGSFNNSPFGG